MFLFVVHFARVFYSNAEDDSNAPMQSRAVTSEKRGKEAVDKQRMEP